jgi:chromosome segregation ATPase
MVELLLILVGILLSATVAAALEYYKQIRKAQREYEKAKAAVEDIVLSFNRQLKKEAGNLEMVAYKVEGNSSKADAGLRKIESIEKKIAPLESQLSTVSKESASTLATLTDIKTEIRNIETSHETLTTQMAALNDRMQKLSTSPEINSETVMPIKRDKAMGALTDTEIEVLEMLSAEGSKTAPEIKERVQLSREHTARLMKKLYEEGYLERETGKIPFKYSVKKEIERLLKKPESTQA